MSFQVKTETVTAVPKVLLIEGWRGINHSIALVNQHQILELLKLRGLKLYHRDLPFAFNHWARTPEGSGFEPDDCAAIENLTALPDGIAPDCVYRIGSPIRAGDTEDRRRTITFMITELGLVPGSFADAAGTSDFFTRGDNAIATSSAWSRQRLLDHGYASDKVTVIPLGVDTTAFSPMAPAERMASRLQVGFHRDEIVFLNVGAALWNKGIDLLLRAFAVLRARGRRVRLLLKDQRDVYGVSVEQILGSVGADCPELLRAETLAAINVIPGKLARAELRRLYGIADAYVSPYRAEGFNLPVLEALACSTPLIVTRGGATDDFCDDRVASRVPGREQVLVDPVTGPKGRYIEPDIDALISAMDGLAKDGAGAGPGYIAAREDVLNRFTWANAAAQLAALTVGLTTGQVARPPVSEPLKRHVQQHEVLSLLGMMRPLAMASGSKVRIGNKYDGGYVLPDCALSCDAVLSIGIGNDVSFDLALADRGAVVIQFDHTIEASPSAHANFRFYKLGWGAATEGDLLSFSDMRGIMGAVRPKHAMLKFDVEGAEYDALSTVTDDDLGEFEIITCELHGLGRLGQRDMFARIRGALEKLTRHHVPVHLHANNYAGLALIAGIAVPEVLELTLLRRDLDRFPGVSNEPIPGILDRPNNPNASDICLRAF